MSALRQLIVNKQLSLNEASLVWADVATCQIPSDSAIDTKALLASYFEGDISFYQLSKRLLEHHTRYPRVDSKIPHKWSDREARTEAALSSSSLEQTAENTLRLAYIVQELHKEVSRIIIFGSL